MCDQFVFKIQTYVILFIVTDVESVLCSVPVGIGCIVFMVCSPGIYPTGNELKHLSVVTLCPAHPQFGPQGTIKVLSSELYETLCNRLRIPQHRKVSQIVLIASALGKKAGK